VKFLIFRDSVFVGRPIPEAEKLPDTEFDLWTINVSTLCELLEFGEKYGPVTLDKKKLTINDEYEKIFK